MPEGKKARPGDSALGYALKLLGYRQRTRKELGERLARKGYEAGETDAALKRLEELGYLDDAAAAKSFKLHAEGTKLLGKAGAWQYMRMRGVGKAEADEALVDYDEEETARKLISKKLKNLSAVPAGTARRRLAGCLGRRGFKGELARRLIDEALGSIVRQKNTG